MIKYVEGNLLEAPAEALVNTVNEVGVMGKGIALMFSEAFPENTAAYIRACQAKQVHVGHMFVTENKELVQPRWIINFPTKKHWRGDSQIGWILDRTSPARMRQRRLGLARRASGNRNCFRRSAGHRDSGL
jgi:O-acetyl-ADP-ribose deacetylase (regulator of RNase III)